MASSPPISMAHRTRVLDAVVGLQGYLLEATTALARGHRDPAVRVLTRTDPTAWTLEASQSWRHLLSTRAAGTVTGLARSLPNNRSLCAGGLRMVSVFDVDSLTDEARDLLAHEEVGTYVGAYAPLQMKIVDDREVLLLGALPGAPRTLLGLSSDRAMGAAWSYWNAVVARAFPLALPTSSDLVPRTRLVLELLRAGLTDEQVAQRLGVSVRTVRVEVRSAMDHFGVRSRFAAGYAYARADRPPSEPGSAGQTA